MGKNKPPTKENKRQGLKDKNEHKNSPCIYTL